jgi:multiple sugar transport system ATP-binding protein
LFTTPLNLFHSLDVQAAGALRVRVNDTLSFPVPSDRTTRYTPHVGKPNLVLGLRPEHITEARPHIEPNQHDFSQVIEVVEPMGMETLVYFTLVGVEVCGRVNPNAGATAEKAMTLRADLSNMHLIDDSTGKVL